MKYSTLDSLMVKRGGSIDPQKYKKETFELLSIPAYDKGEPDITKGEDIGSTKKSVEPGDVLLSKIIPHIRRCWIVPKLGSHRQIASGEWIQFRNDNFYPDYLRHYLTSDPFHKKFMKTVSGVGGSLLRARPALVADIKIPEIDYDDQIRIAHVLSKVEALIAQRKESLQQLDELLKSVFLDMFGDPVRNEKGWDIDRIGKHISLQGGYAFKSKDLVNNSNVKLVKIANVHFEKIIWKETSYVPNDYLEKHKNFSLNEGDLLIALTRPVIKSLNVVKTATVRQSDLPCMLNQRVARFIFDPNYIHQKFLLQYCYSPHFKETVDRLCPPGLQPNISTKQIEDISIIYPPVSLQKIFAEKADKSDYIKSLLQTNLHDLENLYSSLSQKAFKGELNINLDITQGLPEDSTETLTDNIDQATADYESANEDQVRPLYSFPMPAPEDIDPINGPRIINYWMEEWLKEYADVPFNAQAFMESAQDWFRDVIEEEGDVWGPQKYDALKEWVFQAIRDGKLKQRHDEANNEVQVTLASANDS